MSNRSWPLRLALAVALAGASASLGAAHSDKDAVFRLPDHYEFDAVLATSYRPDARGQFPIRLDFDYMAGGDATLATWQVDVLSSEGKVVQRWIGESPLKNGKGSHRFTWDGLGKRGEKLPAGFYTVRLRSVPAVLLPEDLDLPLASRVSDSFRLGREELVEQRYDVRVGNLPAPRMTAFAGLPLGRDGNAAQKAAASTVPYTIYYGNLHSQTNHSDGGAPVASCGGSEIPQGGQFGPTDAYTMMQLQAGGDFLLTSEHNHMYDGSTGTNTSATPAAANNLFNSGLTAAATYNSAHPDFLALYGNEWGVISNGGHLNIINPDALPSWEYNASSQLIGSVATIKSDYGNLYSVMKARGWIGQFNHPSSSQFAIGGTGIAYNADGAEVMVLTEILNTSAFSTNTTETETGRSTFTGAWNTMLERGYKVAPATNQDNHCANWGLSFRNRTGVLLANGLTLNKANFIDALKARRTFASEDKNAQLVLTANGAVMGQTLSNSGALTLTANYASSVGGSASRVQFMEGVPGRNGAVTQLFEGAGTTTITPAAGAHFYYAIVTEADGDRLWSAPVWITQGAGGDTTAPTVSASETGTSGTITLSATASDNVGVTSVEFYVDGVLKGSDATSPYSMTLNSTTLANGSHAATAKAFDAAGNSATSTAFAFSISNVTADTTVPTVSASSTGTSGSITLSATASDNVGVTNVEFYVDGVLKGSDATSPYSLAFDSTTAANGSHSLTAKAFDAAGNSATSSAASFTVSNATSTLFNETESNGNVASANAVARSFAQISGTMGNTTDKDYFRLTLNAGDTIKIDMVGPAGSTYDYDLYLVNASDASLVSSTSATTTETLTYTATVATTVYAKVITYKGSSTTLPYKLTLTYTAGSTTTERVSNGGFESGNTVWTASATDIIDSTTSTAARTGSWKAWLNGYGSASTQTIYQSVTIPSAATQASFSFWLKVTSDETTTTNAYDTLKLQVRNSSGTVLATLATYSNLNKGTTYVQRSFDLLAYKGQTVRIHFQGVEGSTVATSFLIDDVSLLTR